MAKEWKTFLKVRNEMMKIQSIIKEENLLFNQQLSMIFNDIVPMMVRFQSRSENDTLNEKQICCLVGVTMSFTMIIKSKCALDERFKASFDVCLESLSELVTCLRTEHEAEFLETFDEDPPRAILLAWGQKPPQMVECDSAGIIVGAIGSAVAPVLRTVVTQAIQAAAVKLGTLAAEDAYPIIKECFEMLSESYT